MNEYQIIDSRDLPKFLSEGWEYFCPCRPYGIDKLGIWVRRIENCCEPQNDPLSQRHLPTNISD